MYKLAEMSEWFKEHDWKSCVGHKLTGGSNPLLCAKDKGTQKRVPLFYIFEEDLRVEAFAGANGLRRKG